MLRGVMRLSLLAFSQEKNARIAPNLDVARQHDELIAAIREQDEDRAEELIFQHSNEFRERITAFVIGSSTKDLRLG
jgi:DNA-binding GntR family transcriptional regulator